MEKIYLVTTSTCPKCGPAKKYLEQKNIEYELVVADESLDGRLFATNHNIMFVPTIVLKDEGKTDVMTFDKFKQR